MKKTSCFVAVASLLLTATSCSKKITPEVEGETQQQSDIQNPIKLAAPLASAFTDFSFHFFKNLQAEQEADKNIFVSPLSLHIALGMLVNGAKGETKTEIRKALKSEHFSHSELNEAYKKLLTDLPNVDPQVKMALANGIFYKNSVPFEASYLNSIQQNFNAQVMGLPFLPADLVTINKWASDNTDGKISKVLNTIDPDLIMFLMNAIYFKGDWHSKFDKIRSKGQGFELSGTNMKVVSMMNQTGTFDFGSAGKYSALQLPYGGGQFVATFILPQAGNSISSILDGFDINGWTSLQKSLSKQKIEVGIPRFKLDQEFDLKNTLKKMGIAVSFTKDADFENISKLKPLFVDFVKQNTFVAVNEDGTESAAITGIGMVGATGSTGLLKQFICNRPFGIIISEKTSNTILFMGRIMNPEE